MNKSFFKITSTAVDLCLVVLLFIVPVHYIKQDLPLTPPYTIRTKSIITTLLPAPLQKTDLAFLVSYTTAP